MDVPAAGRLLRRAAERHEREAGQLLPAAGVPAARRERLAAIIHGHPHGDGADALLGRRRAAPKAA